MKMSKSNGVNPLAALAVLATLGALPGHAQNAAPAASNNAGSNTNIEEVVVTGIRASLEKSLDVKKNAGVVLDSINATELGRFPDADVADSLAHLPGITITRTTGGEGQKISIRGLDNRYNIVTLNNRTLASDDDGRDLAFDVLPSEVISAADVLKSPEASALEGAIGGTVNLRTASPFDSPGLHVGVHVEGDYNSMTKLYGSKYSAFVSNTLADRKVGFLIGAVVSDNKQRSDSLSYNTQATAGKLDYPYTGLDQTALPCCIAFGSIYDTKKRDALSGNLEWRPSDAFTLVADALWTRLRDPQQGYNHAYYFPTDKVGTGWSNPTIVNGLVTGVTVNNFQPEIVNNTVDRNVDTSLYGLKATWKPTERWALGLDVYRSTANRPEGGNDTFVTAGLVTDQTIAPDTLILTDLPHSLPSFNILVPPSQLGLAACPGNTASATNPGQCSYAALLNSGALNDNKFWSTHYDALSGTTVNDAVKSIAFDGAYDAHAGVLTRIKFGFGDTEREKSKIDISNDWTNGSGQYGSLYLTAGGAIQPNPYSFGSQGFNVISMLRPPNFMQGAGGLFASTLPVLDVQQLLAFMKSLDGKPNPQFCTTLPCTPDQLFNFANTLPQPNPANSYDVTEKTSTFFVETQLAGTNWSGNIGVRVVRTATSATYAQTIPVLLWTNNPNASTVTYTLQYSGATTVTTHNAYTLALPSANLAYWLIPDRLQLRGSVAETMRRPNLNELAPNSTNNAINGQPTLNYTGTAGLKPVKATQYDLSLEWYYQPHSALTVGLYGKKIRDDIYTLYTPNVDLGTLIYNGGPPGTVPSAPFPWNITALANNPATSSISGVELTWQHLLDNGFGIHFQYTHTHSGPINSAPPTTVSVSLLYDKGPFSADINWDHTAGYDVFSGESTEVPGWPAVADSFSWLTASAHYKFGRGFETYIEGRNLTNEISRTYLNGNPLLPWSSGAQNTSAVGNGYASYGRMFVVGLAYRR